jgi:hypothetical protein
MSVKGVLNMTNYLHILIPRILEHQEKCCVEFFYVNKSIFDIFKSISCSFDAEGEMKETNDADIHLTSPTFSKTNYMWFDSGLK